MPRGVVFCFLNILRTYFPRKKISELGITVSQYYMGRIHLCYSVSQSTLCWSRYWRGRHQNEVKCARNLLGEIPARENREEAWRGSESQQTDTNLTLSEWGNGRRGRGKLYGTNSKKSSARPSGEPQSPSSPSEEACLLRTGQFALTLLCWEQPRRRTASGQME